MPLTVTVVVVNFSKKPVESGIVKNDSVTWQVPDTLVSQSNIETAEIWYQSVFNTGFPAEIFLRQLGV